jgi:GPH family glycoside/pentoside/hexuronide:cation symporter
MEKQIDEIQHSKKDMASFGFGLATMQFLRMAFAAFGFFFYEAEIGLNVWLTSLGYIIFAVWNAVNDPFIGYITDRPFKFTKKWGRRFPWIMIGGVPWVISYVLVFTPPNVDPASGAWIIFGWLVFTTCLFDTFNSLWWVNYYALYPDKYRIPEERRAVSGFMTSIGVIGITLGGIVPPLLITYGDLSTYIIQAGIVVIIGLLLLILSAPGSRDDQACIDRYLAKIDEGMERGSFIGVLKTSLRSRPFLAYIAIYMFYQAVVYSIQASIPYVVRFVLKMEARGQLFLQIGFLIGALISIPIWVKLAHKINNNKKTLLIAVILMTIFTLPLAFFNSVTTLMVMMIFWGISLGGFWILTILVFADVIDNAAVETKKREEGVYNGIRQFFARLAIIMQAISFAVVHTLTGFVEGSETQSAQAVWGISIHFGLIPAVFVIIGGLIFWKWYDLTPEKIEQNKKLLKELAL